MEKTLHALVAVAFSAAFLTGCQSPVSSGARTAVSVAGDTIIAASLSVDNPSLVRHIAMTGVRTRLLANGLLEAQASNRVENIPWLDRANQAEKKLTLPKGEDELFAELYEQTKNSLD